MGRPRVLAPHAPALPPPTRESRTERRPNIVLYLVDTLRPDRLGCYGADPSATPELDAWARDATLFETALAQSPWTRPAVVSLFTGLGPAIHGVNGRRDRLAQEAVTLAEILSGEGYATVGFVANGNVARRFGVAQGFERYRLYGDRSAAELNRTFLSWLEERPAEDRRPFFLYLHTVEPHAPYDPPHDHPGARPELRTRRFMRRLAHGEIPVTRPLIDDLLSLYEGEVAWNDAAFGELLDALREEGLYEDTLVIFLSDHGEEFYEHGRWEHGQSLYREVMEVPLLIRFPDRGHGVRVTSPVQQTDLLPTLLGYLGIPSPGHAEGRNLLPLLDDEGRAGAEAPLYALLDVDRYRAASITTPHWHYIEPQSAPLGFEPELYDRRRDPEQLRSLARERPILSGYLRGLLAARLASDAVLDGGTAEIDPTLRHHLRALGYVD